MKKTLTKPALEIIEGYKNLPLGDCKVKCPYFNNKRQKQRAGVKSKVGKGTPNEIQQEAKILVKKQGVELSSLTYEQIQQFLVDNNLGIECSGYAYHILNEEIQVRKDKKLKSVLDFSMKGFIRRFISRVRPVTNTNVELLSNPNNSKKIKLTQIKPADFISIKNFGPDKNRNHILLIKEVEYEHSEPKIITYTHSFRWSKEGKYKHGVRDGTIKIQNLKQGLLDQQWLEKDKKNKKNETYRTAQKGILQIRRLNILSN